MLATEEAAETVSAVRTEAWLLDLGRMDYGAAWPLQRALAARRTEDGIPDGLILVEHDHVVTLGRRGVRQDVLDPALPVFEVERGGEATYHGPGQLVGYPILKLPDRIEVRRLVADLEEVLIRTCRDFGLETTRDGPERGVWIEGRKIASIGLAVQRGVTFHGFAHNVNTDLSYFLKIRPCGHAGSIMTSMADCLARAVEMEDVKASVIVHFQDIFGLVLRRTDIRELLPEGPPEPVRPSRPGADG